MGRVRYQLVHKDGQDIVEEIHQIVFHKILMGDVEDPDLFVAEPLWKWQESDAGSFVMKNAIETPRWERTLSLDYLGWTYYIIAEIEGKKLTEYYLKWGDPNVRNN
jgi:hypothetical protein